MSNKFSVSRRGFLQSGGLAAVAAAMGVPSLAAMAQAGKWGPSRSVFWVPQATGSWNIPIRAGQRDFCGMVGWTYQHIGDPTYSVENHVAQVRNAISAGANVIVTELENPGMTPVFQEAITAGIKMIIIDQGVKAEADKLKLGIIGANGLNEGYNNGWQAATWAQKLTGKTSGVFVFGNGNPGAALIDARQAGSEQGIKDYNAKNGTTYTFEAFPDHSFDADVSQSIQLYGAQIDSKGSDLVGLITGGNPSPIVQALKERNIKPGTYSVGSVDFTPAEQQLMIDGWTFWGTDQQQYLMGLYSMTAAWGAFDGYPYPSITTGEAPLLKADLPRLQQQTKIWQAKAQAYGDTQ
ncbi:MAG: substrate-binding domain-containing protein [Aggregatilineales bacterium]